MDIKGEFTSDFTTAQAHADERALSERSAVTLCIPWSCRYMQMDVQIYGVNACTSPHFYPLPFQNKFPFLWMFLSQHFVNHRGIRW